MNIEMTPKLLFQTTYSLPQIFYLPLCTLNGGDGDPTWTTLREFDITIFCSYKTIIHCGLFICQNSTKLLPWTIRSPWIENKKEETGVHGIQIDSCIRDTRNHALIESQVSLTEHFTLRSHNLISNSPYCLPYNSYDVGLENLKLDLLIIP